MDVMIDLETMGNGPRASIASIGAVVFSRRDPLPPKEESQTFYTRVDLRGQKREFDPDTIYWWLNQGDGARQALLEKPQLPLPDSLMAFREWVRSFERTGTRFDGFWSLGSTFDLVILSTAYKESAIDNPMPYPKHLCLRTMFNLYGDPRSRATAGVKHNALDDAYAQAVALQSIFSNIASAVKNG